MKSSWIKLLTIMMVALGASVAQASNSESVSSSAGESKGDGWWAQINMPFSSYAAYYQDSSQNYVYSSASAQPNATLFGHNYTFLDFSAAAQPTRSSNASSSTTYAEGFFSLAGTTYLNCAGWVRGTNVFCQVSKTGSATILKASQTYVIGGVIPISVTEHLAANFGAAVTGRGLMSTLSNTTTSNDEAIAVASGNGSLVGSVDGWAGIQKPIPTGFGGGVLITFFSITASGPKGDATRTRSGNTTSYRVESQIAGSE